MATKNGYVKDDGQGRTVILTEDDETVQVVHAATVQEAQGILEKWREGDYKLLTE